MLLANYSQLTRVTGRLLGNSFTCPIAQTGRPVLDGAAWAAGEGNDLTKASQPDGYGSDAWAMPLEPGGMATVVVGSGAVSGSAAAGLGASATLAGSSDMSAELGALAGLSASILAVGSIAAASASGSIGASATLAGSSAITAALGLLVGALATLSGSGSITATPSGSISGGATLAGSGSISAAALTAVSDIAATLFGSASMSAAPSALGQLSATITTSAPEDPLSPTALARAVWNAVAAEFSDPGTMGEVLNAAGGGSTPSQVAAAVWAALRATNQDAGGMGEALVELFELMGLDPSKPLVVTPTTRDAGAAISQTIATVGTTTTVTRDP